MKLIEVSTKILAVTIVLGVLIAAVAFWGAARTDASAGGGPSAVFGTINWGVNQTGRLTVTTPTSGQWSAGREGQIVLGFDVFRPNTDVSGTQATGSCPKHHMIERQACQVTLGPGEAASFEVNGDGVSSFQPVVGLGDGNPNELLITLEVMEGGRI